MEEEEEGKDRSRGKKRWANWEEELEYLKKVSVEE
jgi:hypothetical protein